MASDGSSSDFSFWYASTYGKDTATLQSEGWITADGVLAPEHDAAHMQWGGDWRMPTYQELSDLNNKCDWTWTTTQSGMNGYVVRGRGDYASNAIFIPAAGHGSGTSFDSSGSFGGYWSSVPSVPSSGNNALYVDSDSHYLRNSYRSPGRSVRPVQGFAE